MKKGYGINISPWLVLAMVSKALLPWAAGAVFAGVALAWWLC
jgi:hypothetical protein